MPKTTWVWDMDTFRLIKKMKEVSRAEKKVADTMRRVGKESKKTTTSMVSGLKESIVQVGKYYLGWQAVREAIRLATAEWDNWQHKRKLAVQAGLGYAGALNQAFGMAHPEKGLDAPFIRKMIEDNAYYTGLTDIQGANAATKLLSAAGMNATVKDVVSAYRIGGRASTLRGVPDEAGDFSSTLLDLLKIDPNLPNAKAALGVLMYSAAAARIASIHDVAQNVPEAIVAGQGGGLSTPEAIGLFSAITSYTRDVTGDPSVTGAVALLKNLNRGSPFPRTVMRPTKKTIGGRTFTTMEPKEELFPLPFAISPEGRVNAPLQKTLEDLDLMAQSGRFDAARNLFGLIGLRDVIPDTATVRSHIRSAYRSGMGVFRYTWDQAARMSPEQLEKFVQTSGRGIQATAARGILMGDPKFRIPLEAEMRRTTRDYEGGGMEQFGKNWFDTAMTQGGGNELLLERAGKIAGQRAARQNVIGRRQELALDVARKFWEAQPGKTYMGQTFDAFVSNLKFFAGADPIDVIIRALDESHSTATGPDIRTTEDLIHQLFLAKSGLPPFEQLKRDRASKNYGVPLGPAGEMPPPPFLLSPEPQPVPRDTPETMEDIRKRYEGADESGHLPFSPGPVMPPQRPEHGTISAREEIAKLLAEVKEIGLESSRKARIGEMYDTLVNVAAFPWYPGGAPLRDGVGAN